MVSATGGGVRPRKTTRRTLGGEIVSWRKYESVAERGKVWPNYAITVSNGSLNLGCGH